MKLLRFLLYPLALFYNLITFIRNIFYDVGIFKSQKFNLPIIAVGNLSVGGTGKTPQIEYLIRLLQDQYSVATLSRGYKRKSKGFVLADVNSTAENLGDEPFQMHQKFPEINVAVDVNRINGITELLQLPKKTEIILLDDAMQHRKIRAGFYILLTSYNDLFTDDFILPTGNLRESRFGAKRADCIIVTKCPANLSDITKEIITKKIENYCNLNKVTNVFFTRISYLETVQNSVHTKTLQSLNREKVFAVAGIAKPSFFIDKIKENAVEVETMVFSDHYDFDAKDVLKIKEKLQHKIGITTEKDFVRLQDKISNSNWFYLPITCEFISDKEKFDGLILQFVKQFNKA